MAGLVSFLSFFYKGLITKSFYSLDTLLLCNKTSKGPGFKKSEIQAVNTKTIRLGSGEWDEFKEEGFSCIEHYQCTGSDLRLITDGESQTRKETLRRLNTFVYSYYLELCQSLQKFQLNRRALDFQQSMDSQL